MHNTFFFFQQFPTLPNTGSIYQTRNRLMWWIVTPERRCPRVHFWCILQHNGSFSSSREGSFQWYVDSSLRPRQTLGLLGCSDHTADSSLAVCKCHRDCFFTCRVCRMCCSARRIWDIGDFLGGFTGKSIENRNRETRISSNKMKQYLF